MSDESQISEREREILRLIATGATNQQIAAQLNISPNTVKVHVRNIYEKIGVVSRPEATLYAVRTGIVAVEKAAIAVPEVADQAIVAVEDGPVEPEPPAPLPAEVEQAPPVTAPVRTEPLSISAAEPPSVVVVPTPTPAARPNRTLLVGLGALVLLLLSGLLLAVVQPWRGPQAQPTTGPVAAPTNAGAALPAANERWVELAPLPEPRLAFALAPFRFDGRSYMYLIGGVVDTQVDGAVLRYDLDANTWVKFSAKPTPVADVQAAVVGNRIFVPGGRTADGNISTVLEAYDPQRDRWESLAPLPEPRANYGLAAVEGKLYLFGGTDGANQQATVWQYNPDRDEWQPQSPMPEALEGMGVGVIEGQIFLIGGQNGQGPTTSHQRYSPAEEGNGNPYTIRAPLPEARSQMGATAIGGFIFLIGGSQQALALIYDSTVDIWRSTETPLSPDLRNLQIQSNSNRLYLFGGRTADSPSARSYAYQALYQEIVPFEIGK
jgi:DNA-binding CsgD family transcriptional regulator